MNTRVTEHDIIIVGGGISGTALAYGLAGKKHRVAVLDGLTPADNASFSNCGLIWCQSKFLHLPHYARWAFISASLFPDLVRELTEVSGVAVPVSYKGGLIPVLGEEEYERRRVYIEGLREALGEYNGCMIDRAALEKKLPKIGFGPKVVGAAWCENDGLVDPIALVKAYRRALPRLGVDYFGGTYVYSVEPQGGGYLLQTSRGPMSCGRIVLAAGLGNRRLAQFAMPSIPIFPDKGQVLLVERIPNVMPIPILGATQTFDGTVIVGFRHEKAGYDTKVIPDKVASEGKWAMEVWPFLSRLRIIRAWSALRVMPDDNMAIYSRLPNHETATLVNTHSAVTMAAAHSRLLSDFLLGGELPEPARGMTLNRFGQFN